MKKGLIFFIAMFIVKTAFTQTPVFSEDFGTIAHKTTITTSNTSFTNVAIMGYGSIIAQNPSNLSTTGSSMNFTRGNYSDGTNGVAVTGLPSSDVVSIYFVIRSTTMTGNGTLFFGVGSGNTFTGTAIYNSGDLLFGGEFHLGTIYYNTTDGAVATIGSLSNNTTYQIHIVANRSGSTVYYKDLSGNDNSVASHKTDIWINNVLEGDDIGTKDDKSSTAFRMYQWGSSAYYEIDDIKIFNDAVDVLPVELTSFTANVNSNKVQLNWQTATELNNYGFEIERSMQSDKNGNGDCSLFEKIGFVAGNGTSNSKRKYSFIDIPQTGNKFEYRLKQIDNDGKFKYSKTIDVKIETPINYSIQQNFPNPFNPSTKIKYTIAPPNLPKGEALVQLKIYDILGNEIATLVNEQKPAGSYEVEFNASNSTDRTSLTSGIYFYKIVSGNYSEVKKMILLK